MQYNTASLNIEKLNFNLLLKLFLLIAVIIQVLCVIVFAYHGLLITLGPIIIIALAAFTAFSVEKTFFLLAFYVIVFEEYYYAGVFSPIQVYYLWPVASGIYVLLIVYWLIHLLRHKTPVNISALDASIIIFLFYVLVSIVNGYLRGYNGKSWRWDMLPYPFYLSYFIFIYSKLRNKSKLFYDYILILSIPVALTMFYALSQLRGAILLQRVVTQNIHIMQFAIPYAGLTIIYSQSPKRRTTCTLLLPIFTLAVIISQQRALLFTIVMTLFILLLIFMKVAYKSIKKRTKILWALLIIAIVAVPFIALEIMTKESLILTFLSRFYIFMNPINFARDTSWQIRWQEIIRVLPQIKENFLLGAGIGATTISRHRMILQITVDNSYLYILWKMGIIGLVSFLSIYYMAIKRCGLVLRRTKVTDEKIFAASVLFNIVGLLLIGITNASIAHYRFILVWLALVGSIELIARKYD